MIDNNIFLIIVAVALYIYSGFVFKFRWFYYMCLMAGYVSGIISTAIGIGILLV